MSSSSLSTSSSSSPSPPSHKPNLPWVEKYRPFLLKDVVGNEAVVRQFQKITQGCGLPNLILSGPPGTGKTTVIHCLARELLGSAYGQAVLELNASDARGLDVVRTKIQAFSQKKVTLPENRYKMVILDEADSMTSSAQQALRHLLEDNINTRFVLICNTSTKIVEQLQSRCAIMRFEKLDEPQMKKRLEDILAQEGITSYTIDGIQALFFIAQGDMRQVLNVAQSTLASMGSLTSECVYQMVDRPHPKIVESVLAACMQGDLRTSIEKLAPLLQAGYSALDIIGTMFHLSKANPKWRMGRPICIKELADAHVRVAEGVQTDLQLYALLSRLCMVCKRPSISKANQ